VACEAAWEAAASRATDPRRWWQAVHFDGRMVGMTPCPRISVLMSMKDALPYLEEAVSSILNQTVTDFEFIIVDNASSDGSVQYVESQQKKDSRIVLLRNAFDMGQSCALNRGLAFCSSAWIARMDADDVALPIRLERQLEFVRDNADVGATSCLACYIDSRGRRVGRTVSAPVTRAEFHRFAAENLPFGILHPGALIARNVLLELGGYRPEFEAANDIDLWCRISDRHLILVQPEFLMDYRIHGGSLSTQKYELARLKHLWARDCMIARRNARPEPSWEEFLERRRNAPLLLRLNRWRKMHAKRLYRQAAEYHVVSRRARSFVAMGLAAFLQPEYTIPRLKGQIIHANRS
jgi:glycosyltransferase involved in cell wall biosynthesis